MTALLQHVGMLAGGAAAWVSKMPPGHAARGTATSAAVKMAGVASRITRLWADHVNPHAGFEGGGLNVGNVDEVPPPRLLAGWRGGMSKRPVITAEPVGQRTSRGGAGARLS